MKTNTLSSIPSLALAPLAALALVSCGEKNGTGEASSTPTDPALEAAFVDTEPEGAISVIEARKKAAPGTVLTVAGRIAGAMEPFSANYATFVLADDSLMTCERNPGDGCATPWDACCVDPKDIAASRLTVQVVDEEGRPVGQGLKEVHDLSELDGLVVTGTVAEGSNEDNLILNASGIYPKPEESRDKDS